MPMQLTVTTADKHHVLADFYTMPGIAEHIQRISVWRDDSSHIQVDGATADRAQALRIALDLVDGGHLNHAEHEDAARISAIGTYRGVRVFVTAEFTEPAALDITRSFDGTNAAVLDALIGDQSSTN